MHILDTGPIFKFLTTDKLRQCCKLSWEWNSSVFLLSQRLVLPEGKSFPA